MMKTLREKWLDADRRAGYFRFEAAIPVNKIGDWIKKAKGHFSGKGKMVWKYDGCD